MMCYYLNVQLQGQRVNVVKQQIFKSTIVILVFKLILLTLGSESQDLYTNAVSCY